MKVELDVDPNFTSDTKNVDGKVILTSKSEQKVTNVTVKMEKVHQYKKNDVQKTDILPMGHKSDIVDKVFTLKPGEEKSFDFSLPITIMKSTNEKRKDQGGAMKAIGTVGSIMKNKKSYYYLIAEVKVEGTAMSPKKKVEMKLSS